MKPKTITSEHILSVEQATKNPPDSPLKHRYILFFAAVTLCSLLLIGSAVQTSAYASSSTGTPPVIIIPIGTPTPTPTITAPAGKWVLVQNEGGFQTWVWQKTTPNIFFLEQKITPTPVIIVIEPTPCALDAAYVTDVTIPDYTLIVPGGRFDKTWRVRNIGNCDWETGVRLQFVSGSKLNTSDSQPIIPVAPGATVDITVPMRAPESPGTYTGVWQLVDSKGQPFGQKLTVVIEAPSPTPPTPTPTPLPPPNQFSAQLVRWWPNCGISLVKGRIVEPNGDPVNGLRVRVWADGWDGSISLVSGVGLSYGPGEWDVLLRQGQGGKFYVTVWDWQTGPGAYTRVDSDVLVLDFNYTQENCQPDADGHQAAEVRFVRNY